MEIRDVKREDPTSENVVVVPFLNKIRTVVAFAVPAICCTFFMFLQEVVNLLFVSHLNDPAYVAAIGLGNAFINMFGLSIIIGMNGALNTLVSQAAGAGHIDACLTYAKRALIVLLICFLPISAALLLTERVLVAIGQDKTVARYAGLYTLYYLPALFVQGLVDSQRRLLNCLKRNTCTFLVQACGTVVHIGWARLFVDRLGFGLQGIGMACFVTNLSVFIVVFAYAHRIPEVSKLRKRKEEAVMAAANEDDDFQGMGQAESGGSPERRASSFQGIKEYVQLGAPCALMICLEWWAYQVMAFMSGYFGVASQAAQIVLTTILSIGFMVALGLQQASSTLVGQEIGKGNVPEAKQFHRATKYVAFGFLAVTIAITLTFGD